MRQLFGADGGLGPVFLIEREPSPKLALGFGSPSRTWEGPDWSGGGVTISNGGFGLDLETGTVSATHELEGELG